MTVVINLIGAAGCGKSTTALGLTYILKKNKIHVEYVPEYVKRFAWEGRSVGRWHQLSILGRQWTDESICYEKLDVVVTDSPLLLIPFYESYLEGLDHCESVVMGMLAKARDAGVHHEYFFLGPTDFYDPRGRFVDAGKARETSLILKSWLDKRSVGCHTVSSLDADERVNSILQTLENRGLVKLPGPKSMATETD